jgi:hypothetical protein
MATITLTYNARNRLAQKTLDYVLSLGVFETTKASASRAKSGAELTREAIEAVERGEYIVCGSYEDYLKMTAGDA